MVSAVRIFPMSSNIWIFHFIQRHEQGGKLLKPLTLYTGDLRLKCDISRLLLLAQNPDWLIFSYRFLRRSATSFPTQTKTTFQNSGGSFGNWQYIFMRQKGKTLWRNPIFHIADIFYAFDVCMLPAKLSSFFQKENCIKRLGFSLLYNNQTF